MNNSSKLFLAITGSLVLIAIVFFMGQKSTTYAPTQSVSEVNEASDLDNLAQDLDYDELNTIDSELNKIDSDSSTF